MKSITVLVIVLVCIFIEAFATVNFALSQSNVQGCLSSYPLTIAEIRRLRTHRIFSFTLVNERQTYFLKCVFNKIGVLKGDRLHKDNFYEYFGPLLGCKKTRDFYYKCSESSGVYDNLYCLWLYSDYKRERCPSPGNPCAEKRGKNTCSYEKLSTTPKPTGLVGENVPLAYYDY